MSLLTMTVTAPKLMTDVYKWGVDDDYVFESETLAAGSGSDNVTDIGTVLGRITTGAISVGTPVFTGTGNGTITLASPAYAANVQAGNYVVRAIEKTADSGEFEVVRPDGTVDGFAVAGAAYNGQIKFTIADGSTDFDQTAQWVVPVTVASGSGKVVPLNFSATDGSQNVAAVALAKRVALNGGGDQPLLALRRGPAIAREQGLLWPAGATADQIATGIAQLADLGIIVRPS